MLTIDIDLSIPVDISLPPTPQNPPYLLLLPFALQTIHKIARREWACMSCDSTSKKW